MKDTSQEYKELQQQKIVLEAINKIMEEKIKEIQSPQIEHHKIKEIEQQKMLLNEISELVAKKDTSIDEILDIVSHELRTSVVPIKAYSEMLLQGLFGDLTENQKEKLKILQQNAYSLSGLLSDALESQSMTLGTNHLDKTTSDITKLIADVLKKLENKLKESGISVYFSAPSTFVLIDHNKVSKVLFHLIENSIKSLKDNTGSRTNNGIITLSVQENNDAIQVKVMDNGKGIPKDKLDNLFLKYGKVDTSRTGRDAGLGLGLYLCKQIIDAHSGKIWIESQEGVGTQVYFTLPKK